MVIKSFTGAWRVRGHGDIAFWSLIWKHRRYGYHRWSSVTTCEKRRIVRQTPFWLEMMRNRHYQLLWMNSTCLKLFIMLCLLQTCQFSIFSSINSRAESQSGDKVIWRNFIHCLKNDWVKCEHVHAMSSALHLYIMLLIAAHGSVKLLSSWAKKNFRKIMPCLFVETEEPQKNAECCNKLIF